MKRAIPEMHTTPIRNRGETVEHFAMRRYHCQMSYYKSFGSGELLSWDEQTDDVRKHWIDSTRKLIAQLST